MSFFTALTVPPAIAEALRQIPLDESSRPTHPADYHLTLKYLGNIEPDTLTEFLSAIRTIPSPPLIIRLTSLREFSHKSQRVLTALAERTSPLHNLHYAHESTATHLGLQPYAFPEYTPHVTLGRYSQAISHASSPAAPLPFPLEFQATAVTLYGSAAPAAPGLKRYTVFETIPFAD